MTTTQTPSLRNLLRSALDSRLEDVWVCMPGRIESYDATKQRATVQPLVKRRYVDELGDTVAERLPSIAEVPVVFAGGGGFRTTYPVAAGDTCEIRFASCSLDRWLAIGGEIDPEDDRRHNLSDAIAYVGLRDFAHPYASAPTDCMTTGRDGGAVIEYRTSDIRVGGTGGEQPTIKATSYRAAEDTFFAAVAAFAAALATNGAGPIAAPLVAAAAAVASPFTAFNAAAATYLSTIAKVR